MNKHTLTTNMQPQCLCSPCQSFISWTKTSNLQPDATFQIPYKTSFEALEESATHCPLCQHVFQNVLNGKPRYDGREITPVSYRILAEVNSGSERQLINVTWVEDLPFPSAGPRDPVYYLAHPQNIENRVLWKEKMPPFESRLRTVAEWISDCDCHHTRCTERQSVRPRRLLDLAEVEISRVVKLIETSTAVDVDVRYSTLSHCWGPPTSKPPLRTTSGNLNNHYLGIPLHSLNLNFRDAVLISVKLGLRYLWIDSLCIIQDDRGDWEIEAAKMADIYRQSYINLAASAAHDSHGGIIDLSSLHISKATTTTMVRHSPQGPSTRRSVEDSYEYFMIRPSTLKEEFRKLLSRATSPYFARGWVLQEVALAPRTVYFTTDQMMWQCRHVFESEDGAWSSNGGIPALSYAYSTTRTFDFTSTRKAFSTWRVWLESYATRQLTYASDAAAAAAGLINYYKSATGHTPMLGLWKETLYADLQWSISGRPFQDAAPKSNFPTWSWLSMLPCGNPGVSFDDVTLPRNEAQPLHIEQWEEKWSGQPFTSTLEFSYLVISTPVQDALLSVAPTESSTVGDPKVEVQGSCFWFDYPKIEYRLPAGSKHAVKLAHLEQTVFRNDTTGIATSFRDNYLVLRMKTDDPPRYERLGTGKIYTTIDENTGIWGPTGHLENHFKESDRQSFELV
ncbi:HET domain-containing protein [Trichoderma barbatum]